MAVYEKTTPDRHNFSVPIFVFLRFFGRNNAGGENQLWKWG